MAEQDNRQFEVGDTVYDASRKSIPRFVFEPTMRSLGSRYVYQQNQCIDLCYLFRTEAEAIQSRIDRNEAIIAKANRSIGKANREIRDMKSRLDYCRTIESQTK